MKEDLSVRAGDMRDRIAIQSASTQRDATGGAIDSWSDVVTIWASIEPLAGKELEEAQKRWAEVTYQIDIRYYAGLDSTMRVFDTQNGVYYDIRGVINMNNRRRKIQLMCRQRA